MNSKSRLFTSIIAIALFTTGGFFLSNAFAKQRRVSAAGKAPVRAATLPPASPIYVPGTFTFSTPQALTHVPIPAVSPCPVPSPNPLGRGCPSIKDQGIEPEIKVDLFGTVYVTSIHGYPGGVDLFKSTDKGATFAYLGEPDGTQDKCVTGVTPCIGGAGGGDDSIDVSSGGYLYVSSLLPSTVTLSASFDGGIGGVLPGQKWEVNPAASGIPVNDRQWIAAYGPQTVYMTFDQAPVNSTIWFTKSTDAGKTWAAPTMLIPLTTLSRENNVAVDQYNGNIYTTYMPSSNVGQIILLRSTDGGATWTTITAYTGPPGSCVENAFPIIAVDKGGNIHVVFTQSVGCGSPPTNPARTNAHVFLISSADAGATWTSPLRIDSGSSNNSTVMPWAVAGSPGIVDVTWYGSTMASPDSIPANQGENWGVFFAQVTNALSSTPTIAQSQVASSVHNLPICSQGGNCSGNTRDLAEYYTMTIDPDGNANIAYVDELNYCATHPAPNCLAHTFYTKQTSGSSAYTPPAAPAPATFATNLNIGGSGKAEPNAWVDSHNCIFGGAIGGPVDFISKDAGFNFTTHSVVVGSGLHGGDFHLATVPKADGSPPDQIYTADLGVTTVHIGKSTDGGNTYVQPGMNGIAGEVSVSSDRMWLWPDRGVPTASDQTIYLMDHEFTSEEIRFAALTNDFAWSVFTSGTTAPELVLPPTSTLPNTNPGNVFVDKNSHNVFGIFAASSTTTNSMAPPFGKEPNVWDAVGAAPASQGLAPGPFTNHPVFKGVIDSPAQAPSPAPTIPPSVLTYGNSAANIFPSGVADSAGNVYVVWSTNSSRLNAVQSNNSPSTTFDVWFASSHDGGQNFYGPWRVSSGVGTSVFPWIAAGDAGRVDISWYQSSSVPPPLVADPSNPGALTGGPNNMPAGSTWNVMFAQSLDANSREPVFTVSQASDHIIHTGSISNGGTFGSSDRSLLDFFQVAIGPDGLGNIFCADNGTAGLHINYMRQNGGALAVANPSAVTCLPPPPNPISAVSRKTHLSITMPPFFDVDLLPPAPGIECRVGQGANSKDHQVVVTFPVAVTVGGDTVSSNDHMATADAPIVSNPGPTNGTVVTVNLHNVSNAQRLTITLIDVSSGAGDLGNISVPMAVLLGDVDATGLVDSGDVFLVRQQTGQNANSSNFREDVNASGFIDSGDVFLTRQNTATSLP
jgi:hypothetical protein